VPTKPHGSRVILTNIGSQFKISIPALSTHQPVYYFFGAFFSLGIFFFCCVLGVPTVSSFGWVLVYFGALACVDICGKQIQFIDQTNDDNPTVVGATHSAPASPFAQPARIPPPLSPLCTVEQQAETLEIWAPACQDDSPAFIIIANSIIAFIFFLVSIDGLSAVCFLGAAVLLYPGNTIETKRSSFKSIGK
jgi:hypothetical protein